MHNWNGRVEIQAGVDVMCMGYDVLPGKALLYLKLFRR